MPEKALGLRHSTAYGYDEAWADLFTPRQLVALTTFSDLVAEARQQVEKDAIAAGLVEMAGNLRDEPESGIRAERGMLSEYGASAAEARAICVYLSFGGSRRRTGSPTICSWDASGHVISEHLHSTGDPDGLGALRRATPSAVRQATGRTHHWIAKALETLPAARRDRPVSRTRAKAHTRRQ